MLEPLTVRDVAHALGISRFTVYDLIKRGDLPAYRVGNRLRVEPHVLDAFKHASGLPGDTHASRALPDALLDLAGEDGHAVRLDLARLRTHSLTTVTATRLGAHSLSQHHYTGVLLHSLLVAERLVRPVTAWRAGLRRFVLALGADGHAAVIALGEIDPSYGNVPVLVAWERAGDRLGPDEGPLLLVVPSDHRGGRYVRRLTRLAVRDGMPHRSDG